MEKRKAVFYLQGFRIEFVRKAFLSSPKSEKNEVVVCFLGS